MNEARTSLVEDLFIGLADAKLALFRRSRLATHLLGDWLSPQGAPASEVGEVGLVANQHPRALTDLASL